MKSILKLFLGSLSILLIIGCQKLGTPDLTGYVVGKSDNSILVVAVEKQDFSSTGGVDEFYEAISFRGDIGEVKLGDHVKVWHTGEVAESYPGQAELAKVEVIPPEEIEGAKLNTQEVLQKVIQLKEDRTVVIKSIEYQAEKEIWQVEVTSINSEEDRNSEVVEIEDD